MGAWWAQVMGPEAQPFLTSSILALVVLTGLGSLTIAVSVRWSHRWAPKVVVIAWLAALGSWWFLPGRDADIAVVLVAVTVTGFWLVDRGIPWNRRRPAWVVGYAISLIVIALVAIALALGAHSLTTQAAELSTFADRVRADSTTDQQPA